VSKVIIKSKDTKGNKGYKPNIDLSNIEICDSDDNCKYKGFLIFSLPILA